ncbi:probable methyltransferase-like protein 24 [Artemia franciscana]|uniref:probable methyltransferase-like protein 24 n=1 Tax=Artemia franciscana TaxID=6661 RepID=UPI0032DBEDB2
MLLRESRGFFSWLVILTVAWLEIIILWKILCSENIKNELDSCEQVKKRPFGHSGGLSDSAGPLDIVRWHYWNNLGACKNMRFFGGWIWRGAVKYQELMDGHKALCLDENIRPVPGNCLVYSFGVKNDWSFENAMMNYGCEVHGFDPSIDVPKQTEERQFIFHKIGLQGKDEVNANGWQMKTLRSIMKLLGHENRILDFIKLDIEESEYEAIPNMIETGVTEQIKQIALETHNFSMDEKDRQRYYYKYKQIWKLEKHGFIRFNSQAAMGTDRLNKIGNMSDFYCYEMAWYNPKFYFV